MFYRHKKGGLYIALGTALHSETQEPLTVYLGVKGFKLWARPKAMFFEPGRFERLSLFRFVRLLFA